MAALAQQPLALDMFAQVTRAIFAANRAGIRVRVWKMSFGEYLRLQDCAPTAGSRRVIRSGRCYGALIRIVSEPRWTS